VLLASDPSAPLAAYYPVHGGRRPVDDQLPPAFAAFCGQHRDELVRLLRTRSTQTNEIRRCVALRLGLRYLRQRWPGPVSLVEVGASSGLNLLLDRYGYRIGGQVAAAGDTSPVTITCELRGGEPAGDLVTLRGAMDLAAAGPATVVTGDATTDTARLIRELPGTEPVVVFTASLLSYLTLAERIAFTDQLHQIAERRSLSWIFAETPALVASADPGLAPLAGPVAHRTSLYLVGASLLSRGQRDDALLGLADPYLRWLALARNPADDFGWLEAADG
jgi:hypothetical protein